MITVVCQLYIFIWSSNICLLWSSSPWWFFFKKRLNTALCNQRHSRDRILCKTINVHSNLNEQQTVLDTTKGQQNCLDSCIEPLWSWETMISSVWNSLLELYLYHADWQKKRNIYMYTQLWVMLRSHFTSVETFLPFLSLRLSISGPSFLPSFLSFSSYFHHTYFILSLFVFCLSHDTTGCW